MDPYRQTLLMLLAEVFGVSPLEHGMVLDNGSSGYLAVLAGVDAQTASRASRPGNATLAAHCGHMAWFLESVIRIIDGERFQPNWSESWAIQTVDEPAWDALRERLRANYHAVVQRLETREALTDEDVSGSLVMITHLAYHLGEIKQMISAF